MKATVIKATTIRTPQRYYSSIPFGDYCTCILHKTDKGGAIALIDWDEIASSEECITQDLSTAIFVKLSTSNENKFYSHTYKYYTPEESSWSFYACNIFFCSFEEAQKEYVKLNLLWSIT